MFGATAEIVRVLKKPHRAIRLSLSPKKSRALSASATPFRCHSVVRVRGLGRLHRVPARRSGAISRARAVRRRRGREVEADDVRIREPQRECRLVDQEVHGAVEAAYERKLVGRDLERPFVGAEQRLVAEARNARVVEAAVVAEGIRRVEHVDVPGAERVRRHADGDVHAGEGAKGEVGDRPGHEPVVRVGIPVALRVEDVVDEVAEEVLGGNRRRKLVAVARRRPRGGCSRPA